MWKWLFPDTRYKFSCWSFWFSRTGAPCPFLIWRHWSSENSGCNFRPPRNAWKRSRNSLKFTSTQSAWSLREFLLSDVKSCVLGLDLQEEKALSVIVDGLGFLRGDRLRPGSVLLPSDLSVIGFSINIPQFVNERFAFEKVERLRIVFETVQL